MGKRLFLLIVCLFGAFLEGVLTSIPILLCLLTVISIHEKSNKIFVLAFVSGVLLDVLRVDPVGLRSIFYTIFLFLIFLYERKFEIDSLPFVFFSSVIGSAAYLFIFHHNMVFLSLLFSGGFSVILFFVARIFQKKSLTTDFTLLH